MKLLIGFLMVVAAYGQCGASGQLIWNPVANNSNGGWDCTALATLGSGTVTSVGLAGTANQITVTGSSPITASGSWTLSFPAGGVTLPGTTTMSNATIGTMLSTVQPLTSPTPILTPVGADDGVTYSYFATAVGLYGPAAPGATATTTHGPTTLSPTNHVDVSFPVSAGFYNGCNVYRSVGGVAQGLVAFEMYPCNGSLTLTDDGIVATDVLPTTEGNSGAVTFGTQFVTSPVGAAATILSIGPSSNPPLQNIVLSAATSQITAIGDGAGATLSYNNSEIVAIGHLAVGGATHDNLGLIGIGKFAAAVNNSDNIRLIGIGESALQGNTIGGSGANDRLIGIGYQALKNIRSGNTFITAVGSESMAAAILVSAADDVAFGTATLQDCTSCTNNAAFGDNAGQHVSTGSQNILLGGGAGQALTTESGNVMIGYQAGGTATASNKLYIDNSNTATPLIGGDFSTHSLTFTDPGGTKFTSLSTATDKLPVCRHADGTLYSGTNTAGVLACP